MENLPSEPDAGVPFFKQELNTAVSTNLSDPFIDPTFALACHLVFSTFRVVLRRIGDRNVLSYVHVMFVFVLALLRIPHDCSAILRYVPWGEVVSFLNTLARSEKIGSHLESNTFPGQESKDSRPLPEDFQMRGQIWSHGYHPANWFSKHDLDEEERSLELASTVESRTERVLWLGIRMASVREQTTGKLAQLTHLEGLPIHKLRQNGQNLGCRLPQL